MSRRYLFQYQFVVTARRRLAWAAALTVLGLLGWAVFYSAGDGHWPPHTVHGTFTVQSCQENDAWYESQAWLCFGSFRTSPGGALTQAVILSDVHGKYHPGKGARIDAWIRGPQASVATPRVTGRLALIGGRFKTVLGLVVLVTLVIGAIRWVRRKYRDLRGRGEQWPGWE
jgi:hypothetical protein